MSDPWLEKDLDRKPAIVPRLIRLKNARINQNFTHQRRIFCCTGLWLETNTFLWPRARSESDHHAVNTEIHSGCDTPAFAALLNELLRLLNFATAISHLFSHISRPFGSPVGEEDRNGVQLVTYLPCFCHPVDNRFQTAVFPASINKHLFWHKQRGGWHVREVT